MTPPASTPSAAPSTGAADGASSAAGGSVVFEAVGKTFGTTRALDDVSLTIAAGGIFGIIGTSGAGKSTLIRTVNGLERPTTGRVLVEGVDLTSLRGAALRTAQKRTGMIFQQFNLLDTVSVRDNVAMPLRLDGVPAADARRRAEEALDFVGLAAKAGDHPGQLSGGQKQRVGIARALVRRPRVLLSDEATSALDPTTTAQTIELLRRVNGEYGTTIIVVTHEMDVIKDLCHDVAVMEHGRVVEQGSVLDVFVHPQQPITRAFVGTVVPNHIPERVVAHLGSENLWRLLLLDEQVVQPLVNDVVARFGVSVNMLHADMTEIRDHTVGQMIVKVEGAASAVAAARAFVRDRVVSFEEVGS
jgi:D-methionine transport system ATP-binding protein